MNHWLDDFEVLVNERAARLSRWSLVFQRLMFHLAIAEGPQ